MDAKNIKGEIARSLVDYMIACKGAVYSLEVQVTHIVAHVHRPNGAIAATVTRDGRAGETTTEFFGTFCATDLHLTGKAASLAAIMCRRTP